MGQPSYTNNSHVCSTLKVFDKTRVNPQGPVTVVSGSHQTLQLPVPVSQAHS